MNETVIYETHVRGLTAAPFLRRAAAPAPTRGSSKRSLICKSLGITAVELLPVQQFDEQEVIAHQSRSPASRSRTTGAMRRWPTLRRIWAMPAQHDGRADRGRVPRHGQGAAPRRDRGHPRRGVQPHRRRVTRPGRRISFRGLENGPTICSGRTSAITTISPAAAIRSTATIPIVRRLIRDCLRHWVTRVPRRWLSL